ATPSLCRRSKSASCRASRVPSRIRSGRSCRKRKGARGGWGGASWRLAGIGCPRVLLPDKRKEKRQNDAGDKRLCERQKYVVVCQIDGHVAGQRFDAEKGDHRQE